ncbi:ubiquinol oxidase subunit II [Sphingomonas bacterium]|uniref:ubiquinol oxidase subunit II n=1 Tax=Sphingomonas bacterium TaxID=1895847 RepID=UPI00261377A8|nr:ubiquinol oxidase subunit II [Sphingomonas bacterium]
MVAGCAALLGGCSGGVLDPAGDVALQQRNLLGIATALMLLVVVPVMAATVLFAWRYRAGNAGATYDPDFDHSTGLELLIWSVPLLIVIVIGAVTWTSTHLLDPFRPLDRIAAGKPLAANAPHLEVQVVAMDWKWLFILPEQGIATVNELALPVDVPVRFRITSVSQMSTFYAPTMAGMIYAMPGMESTLHAVLNRPGESWGYSGNYTGAGHSDHRFRLRGMDRAGFDRWVAHVKGGQPLAVPAYLQLEKPSEKVPALRFGRVQSDLFARIVNRCVRPNTPCMSDTMRGDMRRGGGDPGNARLGSGTMPGRGTTGDKPVPALQKNPEAGSGSRAPKPAGPGPRERDTTALPPRGAHA